MATSKKSTAAKEQLEAEIIEAAKIASAIIRIDTAMKQLIDSGLKLKTLAILIQADTGLSRADVMKVLDSLLFLKTTYTNR